MVDVSGREYKQLVKGHDDLRQDAVMQQLFRLLNDAFRESLSCQRLRTFQVVPLSPQAGIVEWVMNTKTMGEILVGPGEMAAHSRYRPQDWNQAQCRKKLSDVKDGTDEMKLQALQALALSCIFAGLFELVRRSTSTPSRWGALCGVEPG